MVDVLHLLGIAPLNPLCIEFFTYNSVDLFRKPFDHVILM